MVGVAILFIILAGVTFLIYAVIGIMIGIRQQQVSFKLRIVGSIAVISSWLFGAVGWYLFNPVDARALFVLIPLAIVIGIFTSWSLLPVKRR